MQVTELLRLYEHGPELLKEAVSRARDHEYDLIPVPGQWSIRQLVCHVSDFEPEYADRMKRVLVEENPTVFGGDPDAFAARLRYQRRSVAEELELIRLVRRQMVKILEDVDLEDFQRTCVHSEAGPMTLETLLERITQHIPHHIQFIEQKLAALRGATTG